MVLPPHAQGHVLFPEMARMNSSREECSSFPASRETENSFVLDTIFNLKKRNLKEKRKEKITQGGEK